MANLHRLLDDVLRLIAIRYQLLISFCLLAWCSMHAGLPMGPFCFVTELCTAQSTFLMRFVPFNLGYFWQAWLLQVLKDGGHTAWCRVSTA